MEARPQQTKKMLWRMLIMHLLLCICNQQRKKDLHEINWLLITEAGGSKGWRITE